MSAPTHIRGPVTDLDGDRALTIELIATSTSPDSVSSRLLEAIRSELDGYSLNIGWTDCRDMPDAVAGFPCPPEHDELRRRIERADAVVFAHGIHGFSVPGPTKTLADILGPALVKKPFAVVTAAGSSRSHLAIRDLACSIVMENESLWIPVTVQVCPDPSDQDLDPVDNPQTATRVRSFAAGLVHYASRLAGIEARG